MATTSSTPTESDATGPRRSTPVVEAAYLRNLTASHVRVEGTDDDVTLPPLGEVELTADRLAGFDEPTLDRSTIVRLVHEVTPEAEDRASATVGVVSLVALIAGVGVGMATNAGWGLLAFAATTMLGVLVSRTVTSVGTGALTTWMVDRALLLLVVVSGFGSALVAAWLGNLGATSPADAVSEANAVGLFLVVVQALFLGFAIVFPGLLYFFFERQRAEALRTRFLLNVFRLDDRLRSVPDVEARYGARMKDVFGEGRSVVQQSRRSSPILVCTMVLSLSLVAAFVNLRPVVPALETAPEAAAGSSLLSILTPTADVLPFAFLGAYLYAVNTSLRGYLRGDLRPKAYSQIAGRMLIVVALAALLGAFTTGSGEAWSQWLILTAAFFIGLVPNTFITRMFEVVRQRFSLRIGRVGEPQPLTALQGIDLYDRARLEQEGVTNVEALVHGDLIDLLTQTRIPAGRLVDWLDQAVLHLYAPEGGGGDAGDATIDALIGRRIRTASQLLEAVGYRLVATEDGGGRELRAPEQTPPHALGILAQYRHVIEGIAAEPAMRRVFCWKLDIVPDEVTIHAPVSDSRVSSPDESSRRARLATLSTVPAPRTPASAPSARA